MTLSSILAQSKRRRGLAALLAESRQRRARPIPKPPAGLLPGGVAPTGYEQQLVVQQPPELVRLPPNSSPVVVAERALGLPRQLGAGAVQFGSGGRFLLLPDAVGTGLLLVDTEESLVEGQRLPPFTKKVRRWLYEGGARQVAGGRHNFAYLEIPEARVKPKKVSDRVEALASVIGSALERGRLPEGARRKGSRAAVRVPRPEPTNPGGRWDEGKALFGSRYEGIITNGREAYLLGYTRRRSHTGLIEMIHNNGDKVLALTGQKDMKKHGKGDAAFFQSGAWQMYFTGRTERDALLSRTYPPLSAKRNTQAPPEEPAHQAKRLGRLLERHYGADPDATRAIQQEAQRLVPGVRLQESAEVVAHFIHDAPEVFDAYVEQLYRENRVREPRRHLSRTGADRFQVMSGGTPQTKGLAAGDIVASWRKGEKPAEAVPDDLIPTWDGVRGVWTTFRGAKRAMTSQSSVQKAETRTEAVVQREPKDLPSSKPRYVNPFTTPEEVVRLTPRYPGGQVRPTRAEVEERVAAIERALAELERRKEADIARQPAKDRAAWRRDYPIMRRRWSELKEKIEDIGRAWKRYLEKLSAEGPAEKKASTFGGISALIQESKRRRGLRAMLEQAKAKREASAPAPAPALAPVPAPVPAAGSFEGDHVGLYAFLLEKANRRIPHWEPLTFQGRRFEVINPDPSAGFRKSLRVRFSGSLDQFQWSVRTSRWRKSRKPVSEDPTVERAPLSADSFEGVEQKHAGALKISERYAARALVPEGKKIKGKGWTQILPKNPAPRDVAEAALTHGKWEASGSVRDAKKALERALAAGSGVGFLVVQPYPGRPWEIRWTAPIAQVGKQLFVDQSLAATMEAFRAPAKRYLKLLSDLGWNRGVTYVLPGATTPARRGTSPGHVMITVDDQGNSYVTDGKTALPMRSAKVQALMAQGELPVKSYADLDRALTEDRKANEIGRALSKNTGDPDSMAIDSRSFMQAWPTFAQLVPVPDPLFTLVQTSESHPGLLTFVRPDGRRQGVNPIYLAAAIEAVGAPHTLYVHWRSPLDPILIEGPKGRALVMPMRLD